MLYAGRKRRWARDQVQGTIRQGRRNRGNMVAITHQILVEIEAKTFSIKCPSIKIEKILKGSLDLILSPSPLVKIQIMGELEV